MNFSKINELKPYDLNCNIFDVYSYDCLSMQELLCQFFTKINECVKTSNETIDLAQWLVNEGLKQEVAEKLTTWLNDGTLENLINVTLFENINKKIDNVNSKLEYIEKILPSGKDDDTDWYNITTCIEKNKNVSLGKGVFTLTKPIILKSGVLITGEGISNTVINSNHNDYVFKYETNTNGEFESPKFSSFTINCVKGIKINNCDGIISDDDNSQGYIMRTSIKNVYISAIVNCVEMAKAFNFEITDSFFQGLNYGVYLVGCDLGRICHNRFQNGQTHIRTVRRSTFNTQCLIQHNDMLQANEYFIYCEDDFVNINYNFCEKVTGDMKGFIKVSSTSSKIKYNRLSSNSSRYPGVIYEKQPLLAIFEHNFTSGLHFDDAVFIEPQRFRYNEVENSKFYVKGNTNNSGFSFITLDDSDNKINIYNYEGLVNFENSKDLISDGESFILKPTQMIKFKTKNKSNNYNVNIECRGNGSLVTQLTNGSEIKQYNNVNLNNNIFEIKHVFQYQNETYDEILLFNNSSNDMYIKNVVFEDCDETLIKSNNKSEFYIDFSTLKGNNFEIILKSTGGGSYSFYKGNIVVYNTTIGKVYKLVENLNYQLNTDVTNINITLNQNTGLLSINLTGNGGTFTNTYKITKLDDIFSI